MVFALEVPQVVRYRVAPVVYKRLGSFVPKIRRTAYGEDSLVVLFVCENFVLDSLEDFVVSIYSKRKDKDKQGSVRPESCPCLKDTFFEALYNMSV